MPTLRRLGILVVASALLCAAPVMDSPGLYAAEEPAPAEETVQLLFVQTAGGAAVDQERGTLTLSEVNPATVFFSDRPHRLAGYLNTEEFVSLWREGKDSFIVDPPNATLSVYESGGETPSDLVVELTDVRLSGSDIVYDIRILEGSVPAVSGGAALFIDLLALKVLRGVMAGRMLGHLIHGKDDDSQ